MNKNNFAGRPAEMAGLFTLSIRLVIGWTYFSAFWRRLILDNKLIPDEAGYIGEKFNHFLPNALGIKPLIEYLVTHPEALHRAMVAFTIIEAIVGLLIILGAFTRLMSLGVFGLAMGILLGSGWLGTTCLDEWQIGVLGISGGFTLFLTGSGSYSLDNFFIRNNTPLSDKRWFRWIGSGNLPIDNIKPFVLTGSLLIFGLTLYTNQFFHGGVWGPLHNKSVKPKLEISNVSFSGSDLNFQVYRTEGADVYGSFLIGIELMNEGGSVLKSWNNAELSRFSQENIHNHYVAKVKPGKHALIIPLGAKADLKLSLEGLAEAKDEVRTIKLLDISGIEWTASIK